MTYCLALLLKDGLVFAADSRTNAGVDYVTTYSKMHVFTPKPDRFFTILSAGNLATTQEIIYHVQRDLDAGDNVQSLANVNYLFEAADYLGVVSSRVQDSHRQSLSMSGISGETTLLMGGQIQDKPFGLFMIYPQGNYISASPETPYLQIGESKYGKPGLDRIVDQSLSLEEGIRLCLVSLDATVRSNITVGPPFEVATYTADSLKLGCRCKYEENNPYLRQLRRAWNNNIRSVFENLPMVEGLNDNHYRNAPGPQAQQQSQPPCTQPERGPDSEASLTQ